MRIVGGKAISRRRRIEKGLVQSPRRIGLRHDAPCGFNNRIDFENIVAQGDLGFQPL